MEGTRKGVGAYLSLSLRRREVGWGWALIRGWALIKFFCLQDGRLFEVGANSRLGAYSNKYGKPRRRQQIHVIADSPLPVFKVMLHGTFENNDD